jgi:hypothetical protein
MQLYLSVIRPTRAIIKASPVEPLFEEQGESGGENPTP